MDDRHMWVERLHGSSVGSSEVEMLADHLETEDLRLALAGWSAACEAWDRVRANAVDSNNQDRLKLAEEQIKDCNMRADRLRKLLPKARAD